MDIQKTTEAPAQISRLFYDYKATTFQKFTNAHKKAFELMESYINQFYSNHSIEAVNEDFFDRFYSSFLPLYSLKMSFVEVENAAREWACFCEHVSNQLGISLHKSLSMTTFNRHEKDLQRIYYVIKEVRRYGEIPVLSWEPFVVDIRCYKNMKNREKGASKYVVFEQGYFILEDKIGNNIIFSKEIPTMCYYKVKIDECLSGEMEIGDIIHMSLKKKIFSTAWTIVNVKAYFDRSAKAYLNLGGHKL